MSTSFTRVRQIDPRDKRNKFARKETNDIIREIGEYCKEICIKLFKKIINMLKYIYKYITSIFTFSPKITVKMDERCSTPMFSMAPKVTSGVYKLDELYEPRDKVFNIYRTMHDNIIRTFQSRDYYGCMAACNEYIDQLSCPAYLNHIRATKNKNELDTLINMMNDAIKYSSQSLMLV
jgi:hypothetical protein